MPHHDNTLSIDCLGCRRSIELAPVDDPKDFGFQNFGQRWYYCGCCAESVACPTGISFAQAVREPRCVLLQLHQRLMTDGRIDNYL